MPKIDLPSTDEKKEVVEESRVAPRKKKKANPILVLAIVVVVVVVAGFIVTRFVGSASTSIGKTDPYQAVFLINGQVYFGHVSQETKDQVVLKDIYYLQATQALQQGEGETANSQELSLIKLGNELHGPKDEMRIVRNNVLFVEDLKNDSKVTTAIVDYIAKQKATKE